MRQLVHAYALAARGLAAAGALLLGVQPGWLSRRLFPPPVEETPALSVVRA